MPAIPNVPARFAAHPPERAKERRIRPGLVALSLLAIVLIAVATVWVYNPNLGASNTWLKFVSPDNDFEVWAPGQVVSAEPAPDVVPTVLFQLMPSNNPYGIYYHVKRLDFPRETIAGLPSKMLLSAFDSVRDKDVSTVHGQLVGDFPIALGSNPGREIHISGDAGSILATERMYIVGDRMYIVVAVRKPAQESDAAALRFLDSFHLTTQ